MAPLAGPVSKHVQNWDVPRETGTSGSQLKADPDSIYRSIDFQPLDSLEGVSKVWLGSEITGLDGRRAQQIHHGEGEGS